MFTVLPAAPEAGLKKLINGAAQNADGATVRNIETTSHLQGFLNGFMHPFNFARDVVPTRAQFVSKPGAPVNYKTPY
jgi:hypothetical protein